MSYVRTQAHRARKSELIHAWKPWEKSTGAKTLQGKAVSSRNAYKGGHRTIFRQAIQTLNDQIAKAKAKVIKRLNADNIEPSDKQSIELIAIAMVADQNRIEQMIDSLIDEHSQHR